MVLQDARTVSTSLALCLALGVKDYDVLARSIAGNYKGGFEAIGSGL